MQGERSTLWRRAVLFGVPSLYVILGLLHTDNPEVGDESALFIWLHIAQLFLIGGLAYLASFRSRAIARVRRSGLSTPYSVRSRHAVDGARWFSLQG
jgi:hypothetical protein